MNEIISPPETYMMITEVNTQKKARLQVAFVLSLCHGSKMMCRRLMSLHCLLLDPEWQERLLQYKEIHDSEEYQKSCELIADAYQDFLDDKWSIEC